MITLAEYILHLARIEEEIKKREQAARRQRKDTREVRYIITLGWTAVEWEIYSVTVREIHHRFDALMQSKSTRVKRTHA